MNTNYRKPLPGTDLDYYDTREAVDAIVPGAYDSLPYTSRVLAEQLVRRCDPAVLEDSLRQIIERRRDLDFPWYPARVVCHDILGQTALVDHLHALGRHADAAPPALFLEPVPLRREVGLPHAPRLVVRVAHIVSRLDTPAGHCAASGHGSTLDVGPVGPGRRRSWSIAQTSRASALFTAAVPAKWLKRADSGPRSAKF